MTTATPTRLLLRSCARCRGDLLLDREEDEYTCLQCGWQASVRRALAAGRIDSVIEREMTRENPRLRLLPNVALEVDDDAA